MILNVLLALAVPPVVFVNRGMKLSCVDLSSAMTARDIQLIQIAVMDQMVVRALWGGAILRPKLDRQAKLFGVVTVQAR